MIPKVFKIQSSSSMPAGVLIFQDAKALSFLAIYVFHCWLFFYEMSLLNQFHFVGLFLYPLKTSETSRYAVSPHYYNIEISRYVPYPVVLQVSEKYCLITPTMQFQFTTLTLGYQTTLTTLS